MLLDLPELVLHLVCEHLSYEDLLVLRSICKGLKQFVDGREFTKLNVFLNAFPYHRRLFYTDQSATRTPSMRTTPASSARKHFENSSAMCRG